MFIPILLGTGRQKRASEKPAHYMLEQVTAYGKTADKVAPTPGRGAVSVASPPLGLVETELIDIRDFELLSTDKTETTSRAQKWSAIMKRADGLIIVCPEYNHSYPGELKIMLDEIYPEYRHKPLGICGVSAGGLGGARMVEQLRLVAIELWMVNIRSALYFSNVQSLFDEKGTMKDAGFGDQVKVFLDELVWYAKALKTARE